MFPLSRLLIRAGGVVVLITAATAGWVQAQSPVTLPFGPGRNASQPGTVTLLPRGEQTEVSIELQADAAAEQPVHFHEAGCPGVGGVTVPLNEIRDGKSTTTVDYSLQDLLAGRHGQSINVHRGPGAEIETYTACVNMLGAGGSPALGMPPTGRGGGLPGGMAGLAGWLVLLATGAALAQAVRGWGRAGQRRQAE